MTRAEVLTELTLFGISALLIIVLLVSSKHIKNTKLYIVCYSLLLLLLFFFLASETRNLVFLSLYTLRIIVVFVIIKQDMQNEAPAVAIIFTLLIVSLICKYFSLRLWGQECWFILIPFVEELFYRGIIFKKLENTNTFFASIVFSLTHLDTGSFFVLLLSKLFKVGVSEVLYFIRRKGLAIPALGVIHLLFNIGILALRSLLDQYASIS